MPHGSMSPVATSLKPPLHEMTNGNLGHLFLLPHACEERVITRARVPFNIPVRHPHMAKVSPVICCQASLSIGLRAFLPTPSEALTQVHRHTRHPFIHQRLMISKAPGVAPLMPWSMKRRKEVSVIYPFALDPAIPCPDIDLIRACEPFTGHFQRFSTHLGPIRPFILLSFLFFL